jgi:D-alanine-D-alanine ligase
MPKIRVGVLRGGPSVEHEISLLTGANILENLPKEKYQSFDILISKTGKWPDFPKIDVIFNALHGEYGEDGQVQMILEKNHLPYTGSGVMASALAMNKWVSRQIFQQVPLETLFLTGQAGLKVPPAIKLKPKNPALPAGRQNLKPNFDLPWIIKPVNRGSSVGISLIKNLEEFLVALNAAFRYDNLVMVEKFISGREVTCGILENFQHEKYFALPVIEIIPPANKSFFDYQCKYDGTTQEICPAEFNKEITQNIQETARRAHQVLGCRDYSRADMIVAEDGVYILEVNTLPGLTKESLLPKAAARVGYSFDQLLDHLLTLALKRRV